MSLQSLFRWAPYLAAAVFLPVLAADQVVLKNGDTITGTIIKKDGAKLTFKSEFLGEVTMPWSAVKSLQSEQEVTVVLPGGESVAGKLSTSGDNLEVAGAAARRTAILSAVDAIRNPAEQLSWERIQHPGILQLWTGFFDLGFALTRGNSRTDSLTTNVSATRVTRHDKIAITFNQIHAGARINGVTSTIASAVRGGWTYNRDFTPRLFVSTMNTYEHDRFQQLDLRFLVGGGIGANVVKNEKTVFSVIGAVDYERENFTNNLHRDSAEFNVGNDFLYRLSASTNLTQSFRFFSNLSDTGAYRANFDIAGVTTLKKWLGWHLTAGDRYLNNPVFGRQRNDLVISTGLRVTFAK